MDIFNARCPTFLIEIASERRTKLYCSEMSKKLFSDYHDRGTSEPNGLEIMFTFILTLSSTLGWQ
ncbi:hypothetical protein T06_8773 [Trichinella sp. T6]|nr:hypothetical protein T06_8773 [Trichinella sp. T6]